MRGYVPLSMWVSALGLVWYLLGAVIADSVYHDYIVVGAGPAGLQLGYFLERAHRNYIILEKGNVSGAFFTEYPRHDRLISINKRNTGKTNKEFNLRHDWNSLISDDDSLLFKHYSREFFPNRHAYVKYLNDYERKLGLNVQHNTAVENIQTLMNETSDRPTNYFRMNDQNGNIYSCQYLVLATGIATPNRPSFTGVDLTMGYEDMPMDPEYFEGKSVLILGRGNTAFEVAESIYGNTNFIHMMARTRVRLAWATHYVGDLRAVNNALLDTYQLKSLDGVLEAHVEEMNITERNGKLGVGFIEDIAKYDNYALREEYDHVIRCLGFKFDYNIFDSDFPLGESESTKKYPDIDHAYQSTAVPNLYFAGTNTHSLDRRKSSGGFIHGFRYTTRVLHRLLEWRNHGVPWESTRHSVSDLLSVLVKRINEVSGLYQMFSVLGDIIVFRNGGTEFDLYLEFPLRLLAQFEDYTGHAPGPLIVISLEYGHEFSGPGKDVFRAERATGEPSEAHHSNFLHPLVYFYKTLPHEADMIGLGPKQVLPRPDRLHVMVEDFLSEWNGPTSHILPFRRFLENILDMDLRSYYAADCLKLALLHQDVPESCWTSALQGQGLVPTERMVLLEKEAVLMKSANAVDV